MSCHNDSLAVLTLSPSNTASESDHRPIERRIDRSTLLDVAPDRESLLMSNKTIEELRQILKIQVGRSTGYALLRGDPVIFTLFSPCQALALSSPPYERQPTELECTGFDFG
jgi:hypothetical protein